jgi:hypothetical protein
MTRPKKKTKDESDVFDNCATMFSTYSENEIRVKKEIDSWHICRCYRCKKQISLLECRFDGNENPIHKVCPP